jgi:ribosome-binding factor A
MSVKIDRISSQVLKELSSILLLEAKDETFKHITLTGCVVTNDLSFARVYYTYMGDEDLKSVADNLKTAEPYLRTVLANRIDIRHTPELIFEYDNSIEYGQKIEKIIESIHEKEESNQ